MKRPPQDSGFLEFWLSVVGCVFLFLVALGLLILAALFGGSDLK